MRESLKDSERLEHIIEAIDNIFEFVNGVSFDEYIGNKMMQFAIVKNLENVGEASYKLTNELRAKHTEIDWKKIMGMRNVLIHGYHQIKNEKVWSTVTNDLSQLREQIKRILDNL